MSADRFLQLLMLVGFGAILFSARELSFAAALAPVTIAVVGLILVAIVAFATPEHTNAAPLDLPEIAGVFGLLALVGLFGVVYGGALGASAHLRLLAKRSYRQCALAGLGWIVVAHVVFNGWLDAQLPQGLLSYL